MPWGSRRKSCGSCQRQWKFVSPLLKMTLRRIPMILETSCSLNPHLPSSFSNTVPLLASCLISSIYNSILLICKFWMCWSLGLSFPIIAIVLTHMSILYIYTPIYIYVYFYYIVRAWQWGTYLSLVAYAGLVRSVCNLSWVMRKNLSKCCSTCNLSSSCE